VLIGLVTISRYSAECIVILLSFVEVVELCDYYVEYYLSCVVYLQRARVIAQAVSRRFLTAAPGVRSEVRSRGISDGQNGIGSGFLQVLRFPQKMIISAAPP
jgi:hypothetical protein